MPRIDATATLEGSLNCDRMQIGVRAALELMVFGRDYARVEDILRALSSEAKLTHSQHTIPIRVVRDKGNTRSRAVNFRRPR